MKQKLLLFLALVGFAVNAMAWGNGDYKKNQQYFETHEGSCHRDYGWFIARGINAWNPIWRNANLYFKNHQDSIKERTEDGWPAGAKYWREMGGHGYITAVEWDNEDRNYCTVNGHKYLISWVRSKGKDYSWDADEYEDKYYGYEGYARLLSRAYNVDDKDQFIWWHMDSSNDHYWNYEEGAGSSKDHCNSTVNGDTNKEHRTLSGAWDITDTPHREDLYVAIDNAYEVRDEWNDVFDETGSTRDHWLKDTLVIDPASYAGKEINRLISEAISVFKDETGDATICDARYLAAAKNLNSRVELLCKINGINGTTANKYQADSLAYVADTIEFNALAKENNGIIAGMVYGAVQNEYKFNHDYSFAHSREMMSKARYAFDKVKELTTPAAQKYFTDVMLAENFKTSKSKGRTKTEAGRDTIAYVNLTTLASYISKSDGIAIAAKNTYEKAITDIYKADEISTEDAKKAADNYVTAIERSISLYAAEVNAMACFDSVAYFMNDTLQSSSRYDVLKASLDKAQKAVIEAETKEAVDQAVEALMNDFALYNTKDTEWSYVAWKKHQVYYTDIVENAKHLKYIKYEGNWKWNPIWRNYEDGTQIFNDNHLEKMGHGAIEATEWDNEEGHFNTQNGHKYLISYVWSDGKTDAYNFFSKNYEGYARLLSRRFNDSNDATGTFNSAYWGTDDTEGVAYSEYNADPLNTRISGTQRSYHIAYHGEGSVSKNQNITVTGAWDVTNTPSRDSLFKAIDKAYNTRDTYTGTSDYKFSYPADCRAHQTMDAEIEKAIAVFKKDNQSDDVYKTAAIALKDRMDLLVKWHADSVKLLDANHLFEMKYDDNVNKNPGVDMFAEFVKRALVNAEAPANYTYGFGQSFQILKDEPAALETVTSMSTELANAFYENEVCTGKVFEKKPGTQPAGFTSFPYMTKSAYNSYYERAKGVGNAVKNEYNTTLAQLYAAPAIDTTAIKNAADKFVEGVVRCANLYSTEVNAMAVLDKVATFVNDSCVNQKSYDNIRAEYIRTEKAILEAETMQSLDNQVVILLDVFEKAKANNTAELDMAKVTELNNAQVAFIAAIDSVDYLHLNQTEYAYPKQILTDAVVKAKGVYNTVAAIEKTNETVAAAIEQVADAKKALLAADAEATKWEKTIADSLISALAATKTLNYYNTNITLSAAIVTETAALKSIADTKKGTEDALASIWGEIQQQTANDVDATYANAVYQRATKSFNDNKAKLTAYQQEIFEGVIENGKNVCEEAAEATHNRFYFANWALDFAMQMDFTKAETEKSMTLDEFLSREDTQLEESMAMVYSMISAGKIELTSTVEETVAEAAAVYADITASDTEIMTANSKVKALLSTATGINEVNAEATSMKNGKFINSKNQVIIVKNGKQFTTAGQAIK